MPAVGYDQTERLPGSHDQSRNPLGEGGVPAFEPPPGTVPYHDYPPPIIPPPESGPGWMGTLPGFSGPPAVSPNTGDAQGVSQIVTVGQGQNVEIAKGMQGMSLMFLVGLAVLVLLIR